MKKVKTKLKEKQKSNALTAVEITISPKAAVLPATIAAIRCANETMTKDIIKVDKSELYFSKYYTYAKSKSGEFVKFEDCYYGEKGDTFIK